MWNYWNLKNQVFSIFPVLKGLIIQTCALAIMQFVLIMQRMFNLKKKNEINLEWSLWEYLKTIDTQMGYRIVLVIWLPKITFLSIKFNNIMGNKWTVVKNYHQILGKLSSGSFALFWKKYHWELFQHYKD